MKLVLRHTWEFFKQSFRQLRGRKPEVDIQREIFVEKPFEAVLKWWHLTGIGLGGTIGAGIFVLGGKTAANNAGPSVIISFILSGIVALLAAVSFTELTIMIPHSGAAYVFTYVALGEYLAWFIGWTYALFYQMAALTVVVAWSTSVQHLFELIANFNVTNTIVEAPIGWNETGLNFYVTGQVINLPAIVITIAITLILVSGIRPTANFNFVLVVFKITILVIFIFACVKHINPENYKPFLPSNKGSFDGYGVTGMLQASATVFFAFLGFESIATAAQETQEPIAKSIRFATIASVVISMLIYIGICTVMVGLVPYKLLASNNPLAEAIKATPYGLWLSILIDLGAIAALTTVALTMLYSQTRIFFAMAFHGLLPKVFAKVSNRTRTPWISIMISGVFCAVISGVFPVNIIGETASISALVIYFFVHVEVIVMHFIHRQISFKTRLLITSLFVPILGGVCCILLMTTVSKETGYGFLVWTVVGQFIYFGYGFWHSNRRSVGRKLSMNNASVVGFPIEPVPLGDIDSNVGIAVEVHDLSLDDPEDIITMYL